MSTAPIRLLALIEAGTVTGPAKNLIEFCRQARTLETPIEISFVTFRRLGAPESDEFLEAAGEACIPVDVIYERGPFDPNTTASLRRVAAKRNPDIVQTHAVKSHFLLRRSGLWRERPWVAFHEGYTLTDTKMRVYNLLDLWSLRAPARIVTVCDAFERLLTARGAQAGKITVLHSAVDAQWLERSGFSRETARRSLGIAPESLIVLAVGRLSREKAFGDMVEAMGRLRNTHPKLCPKLYIAGEGPDRMSIERRIAALGLRQSVELAGATRQMAPYFAAADVMAISSVTEGSPNVLLEAMAARVPVVATRVGGIPEIVTDQQSALLVPPRNPTALANALAHLLSHPEQACALADRAHQIAVDRHSPAARARLLTAIYAGLAHR